MKIYIVVTDVVNDVTYSRKSVITLHVWSYDFYDMTLSTGKQRRHMISTRFVDNLASRKSKVLLFKFFLFLYKYKQQYLMSIFEEFVSI